MSARQKKQFRVKSEPLDSLLLKKNATAIPREYLEAALCIPVRKPEDKPHRPVEQDPRRLAGLRLVHLDQAAVNIP